MPDPLGPLFEAMESINNELTAIAARLARLEDGRAAKGSADADDAGARPPGAPILWHKVHADDLSELWAEFVSWVIRMADVYELTTEQLPRECWWTHGAVVAELTALWIGWQSAYNGDDDAAAGPYLWHDAWSRGIERIGRMWVGECTAGAHTHKSRKAMGTDAVYRAQILKALPPGVSDSRGPGHD